MDGGRHSNREVELMRHRSRSLSAHGGASMGPDRMERVPSASRSGATGQPNPRRATHAPGRCRATAWVLAVAGVVASPAPLAAQGGVPVVDAGLDFAALAAQCNQIAATPGGPGIVVLSETGDDTSGATMCTVTPSCFTPTQVGSSYQHNAMCVLCFTQSATLSAPSFATEALGSCTSTTSAQTCCDYFFIGTYPNGNYYCSGRPGFTSPAGLTVAAGTLAFWHTDDSVVAAGGSICLPTLPPTLRPSDRPTSAPVAVPTRLPTDVPTTLPTLPPSARPTDRPTRPLSAAPTTFPTRAPSTFPPSFTPTQPPTVTAVPSSAVVATPAPSAPPGPTPDNGNGTVSAAPLQPPVATAAPAPTGTVSSTPPTRSPTASLLAPPSGPTPTVAPARGPAGGTAQSGGGGASGGGIGVGILVAIVAVALVVGFMLAVACMRKRGGGAVSRVPPVGLGAGPMVTNEVFHVEVASLREATKKMAADPRYRDSQGTVEFRPPLHALYAPKAQLEQRLRPGGYEIALNDDSVVDAAEYAVPTEPSVPASSKARGGGMLGSEAAMAEWLATPDPPRDAAARLQGGGYAVGQFCVRRTSPTTVQLLVLVRAGIVRVFEVSQQRGGMWFVHPPRGTQRKPPTPGPSFASVEEAISYHQHEYLSEHYALSLLGCIPLNAARRPRKAVPAQARTSAAPHVYSALDVGGASGPPPKGGHAENYDLIDETSDRYDATVPQRSPSKYSTLDRKASGEATYSAPIRGSVAPPLPAEGYDVLDRQQREQQYSSLDREAPGESGYSAAVHDGVAPPLPHQGYAMLSRTTLAAPPQAATARGAAAALAPDAYEAVDRPRQGAAVYDPSHVYGEALPMVPGGSGDGREYAVPHMATADGATGGLPYARSRPGSESDGTSRAGSEPYARGRPGAEPYARSGSGTTPRP